MSIPVDSKKLGSLLKKTRKYKGEDEPALEPIHQMVYSFLHWNATHEQAEAAYTAIFSEMVDVNELRVSRASDLIAALGADYPMAKERVLRLLDCLQEVFDRERATTLENVKTKGKKDIRSYLQSLPGMTPYVEARITLLSCGGHALPIDGRILAMLRSEGAADAEFDIESVVGSIERQVRADEALETYQQLQAAADAADLEPVHEGSHVPAPPPPVTTLPPQAKSPAKKPAEKAEPAKTETKKAPAKAPGKSSKSSARKTTKKTTKKSVTKKTQKKSTKK